MQQFKGKGRAGRLWRDFLVLVLSLAAGLGAAGCGAPSAEEIQAQFKNYVSGANQCAAASECAVASAACPLGCFVAVRADRKADVEAKARELIDDYERGNSRCVYGGCALPGALSCTEGRCAVAVDTGQ
jgi:hypothetical protein